MVVGVGIDRCSVERMKKAGLSEAFRRRVFTEGELGYAASRGAAGAQSLAAMFAAKEAFAKATGLGLARVGLKNVEVAHDAEGRPRLVLNCREILPELLRKARFHLSLTHEGGVAAAVVICETEGVETP